MTFSHFPSEKSLSSLKVVQNEMENEDVNQRAFGIPETVFPNYFLSGSVAADWQHLYCFLQNDGLQLHQCQTPGVALFFTLFLSNQRRFVLNGSIQMFQHQQHIVSLQNGCRVVAVVCHQWWLMDFFIVDVFGSVSAEPRGFSVRPRVLYNPDVIPDSDGHWNTLSVFGFSKLPKTFWKQSSTSRAKNPSGEKLLNESYIHS